MLIMDLDLVNMLFVYLTTQLAGHYEMMKYIGVTACHLLFYSNPNSVRWLSFRQLSEWGLRYHVYWPIIYPSLNGYGRWWIWKLDLSTNVDFKRNSNQWCQIWPGMPSLWIGIWTNSNHYVDCLNLPQNLISTDVKIWRQGLTWCQIFYLITLLPKT